MWFVAGHFWAKFPHLRFAHVRRVTRDQIELAVVDLREQIALNQLDATSDAMCFDIFPSGYVFTASSR